MSSPHKIVNGDYYQINKSGQYQRHQDVKVHSYDHQNFMRTQKKQIKMQKQKYDKLTNSNFKNNENSQILTPKFTFPSTCAKILQKQEVASIHQQDLQQQNIKQKYEETNKNIKMKRSTQYETTPKKGILKRSMAESKMQIGTGKKQRKNQIMNRSVRIENAHLNNQCRKLESQCQISIQRLPSTPSQIEDEHRKLRVSKEKRKTRLHHHLNSHQSNQLNNNKKYPLSSRLHSRPTQLIMNTQGMDTVTNSFTEQKGKSSQGSQESLYEEKDNTYYSQTVNGKLKAISLKLNSLQQQLHASEQRMKSFALQQQLREKQAQMVRIKRQNEYLKQMQHNKSNCSHQSKAYMGYDKINQNMQWKLSIAVTVVILLLFYLAVIKPMGNCNKI